MRYIVAATLLCAFSIATPTAFALPTRSPVISNPSPIFQIAKRGKAPAQRKARGGNSAGGIHPLVGSGDY